MHTHTTLMTDSGTSRRVMVFTHDGAGQDGKPAVIFNPEMETWLIEKDPRQPLAPADFSLVKEAIKAIEAHIASVTKALVECAET